MKEESWFFRTAGTVLFGIGAAEKTGMEVRRLHGTRALVITDKELVKVGVIEKIRGSLRNEGIKIALFDKV